MKQSMITIRNNEFILQNLEDINFEKLNLEEYIKNNIIIEGNINLSKNGNAKQLIKAKAEKLYYLSNKEEVTDEELDEINLYNMEMEILIKYFDIKTVMFNQFILFYNYSNFFVVNSDLETLDFNIDLDLDQEFDGILFIDCFQDIKTKRFNKCVKSDSIDIDLSKFIERENIINSFNNVYN